MGSAARTHFCFQTNFDNETVPVVKRLELQLLKGIPQKVPSAKALSQYMSKFETILNDSLLRHQVLPRHLLVVFIQRLHLPQPRSEIQ